MGVKADRAMNYKTFFLLIVLLVLLGGIAGSKSLKFEENYCVVGNDCTLNDLFLTGNFSFLGDIMNITILNQNVTGQLSVTGNISADSFIGDGSKLTGITTSTSVWNSTGTNVYLNDSTSSIGIGTATPDTSLTVAGDANIANGYGLVIGHTAQVPIGGFNYELEILGTAAPDSSFGMASWRADSAGPAIRLGKSRNPTIGSFTIVSDGDYCGSFMGTADDGTDLANTIARIDFKVDDPTPAENDIGGAIIFQTAAGGGGGGATEKMRFDHSGNLGIGTASPTATLDVQGTLNVTGNTSIAYGALFVDNTTGKVFIGKNYANGSNSRMNSSGLTIMSDGINEVLALKGEGVNHNITGRTEADTFLYIEPQGDQVGGAAVWAFTSAIPAYQYWTVSGTDTQLKTTGATGAMSVRVWKGIGNNIGHLAADSNMLAIRDGSTTRFIFDLEGTLHSIGDAGTDTFGAEGMTVMSGNVGIGTTTPNYKLEVNGIIDADNVFTPKYLSVHTAVNMSLTQNEWTNVTFPDTTEIGKGIDHDPIGLLNTTMNITASGIYLIEYFATFIDTAAQGGSEIAIRVTANGTEIVGSLIEETSQKQGAEFEISDGFLANLTAPSMIHVEVISDATTVSLENTDKFGEHPSTMIFDIIKIDKQ